MSPVPIVTADTNCACEIRAAVNFNDRQSEGPDMLVLHYTGMPDGDQALNWLCVEESQVSCHYLIHDDGRIVQMVRERDRAWHAGQGSWRGHEDINSRSIGIEVVNPGHEYGYPAFPEAQMQAVIGLCQDILARHSIAPRDVIAHSDLAPSRKRDPGEKFPWDLLYRNGIGHLVEPLPITSGRFLQRGDEGDPVLAFQNMLGTYGYRLDASGYFDETTEFAVMAFQRHFRPERLDGIGDASTIETLYRLLQALPDANS
jgi:N-acetylmuramoyl-L-alanine amidase